MANTEKPILPINKYSVHEAKSLIDQTIIEVNLKIHIEIIINNYNSLSFYYLLAIRKRRLQRA